jgi:hypothetical protein
VAILCLKGHRNIVFGRKPQEDRRDLKRPGQTQMGAFMHRESGDISAFEVNSTGIRFEFPGKLPYGRGFSCTVWPDHGEDLTGPHIQRKPICGSDSTKGFG